MGEIDFIITWVDGSDPEWIAEKEKYSDTTKSDNGNNRYRDWDILKYWFRGVAKFAPWVRKIHFVTWGHIPEWLDINNPKINIVRHEDFIPKEYLPTFSSRPIELNLHRIKGLSEKFVYFNDDMFILKKVKQTDFFKNGLPCDTAILNNLIASKSPKERTFAKSFTAPYFNMLLINSHFSKKSAIKNYLFKWFNIRYGLEAFRTLLLMPWSKFPGFMNYHLPYSYLKSTYKEVWFKEFDILNDTCKNKFRKNTDVSSWIMTYWQLAKGNFFPRNPKIGKYYSLSTDANNSEVNLSIRKQKYRLICINDTVEYSNELKIRKELQDSFLVVFPEKSTFEKHLKTCPYQLCVQ